MSEFTSFPIDTYFSGSYIPITDCITQPNSKLGSQIQQQLPLVPSQWGGVSPLEQPQKSKECCAGTWSSCLSGGEVQVCGPNANWTQTFTPFDPSNNLCANIPLTRSCDVTPLCPIDCETSEWSNWSQCNGVCDLSHNNPTGTQTRTKTIITKPQYAGIPCGPLSESRSCTTLCPVNCSLAWGTCSAQSGLGTQKQVIKDYPANGGTNCSALLSQSCVSSLALLNTTEDNKPQQLSITVTTPICDVYMLTARSDTNAYSITSSTTQLTLSGLISGEYTYTVYGYNYITGPYSHFQSNQISQTSLSGVLTAQSMVMSCTVTNIVIQLTAYAINSTTIQGSFQLIPTGSLYGLICLSTTTSKSYTSYLTPRDCSNNTLLGDCSGTDCSGFFMSLSGKITNCNTSTTISSSNLPLDKYQVQLVVWDSNKKLLAESNMNTITLLSQPTLQSTLNIINPYKMPYASLTFSKQPNATSYVIQDISGKVVTNDADISPFIIAGMNINPGNHSYIVTAVNDTGQSTPSVATPSIYIPGPTNLSLRLVTSTTASLTFSPINDLSFNVGTIYEILCNGKKQSVVDTTKTNTGLFTFDPTIEKNTISVYPQEAPGLRATVMILNNIIYSVNGTSASVNIVVNPNIYLPNSYYTAYVSTFEHKLFTQGSQNGSPITVLSPTATGFSGDYYVYLVWTGADSTDFAFYVPPKQTVTVSQTPVITATQQHIQLKAIWTTDPKVTSYQITCTSSSQTFTDTVSTASWTSPYVLFNTTYTVTVVAVSKTSSQNITTTFPIATYTTTPCPSGYYCLSTDTTGTALTCPLNTTSDPNSNLVTQCYATPGYYGDGSGNALTCPVANYCPKTKLTNPLPCPAGQYCPSAGLSTSTVCPAGSYCTSGLSFPTYSTLYSYTGTLQTYTVPNGVTQIIAQVSGVKGGGSNGGGGSLVTAVINVTPGQILTLVVGGQNGVFGGGIGRGDNTGNGGDYSGIFNGNIQSISGLITNNQSISGLIDNILVVAAGGGGGNDTFRGGNGGLPGTDAQVASGGGYGATYTRGGDGGTFTRSVQSKPVQYTGSSGKMFQGGNSDTKKDGGGGGGGGYYGGGGGAYNAGGGGTSFISMNSKFVQATSGTEMNSVGSIKLYLLSQSYSYTGSLQTYTVPSGVKQIVAQVSGVRGGGSDGGTGSLVTAMIPVIPGQILTLVVGGQNGVFGGGKGDSKSVVAGNGGDYSGIFNGNIQTTTGLVQSNAIVIASGGGGSYDKNRGGNGGITGTSGSTNTNGQGGTGATQTQAGIGGSISYFGGGWNMTFNIIYGSRGDALSGGNAYYSSSFNNNINGDGGGGGGGGYWGGGGGIVNGGGGGSSYTDPTVTLLQATDGSEFKSTGSITIYIPVCGPGNYCPAGSTSNTLCPPGSYCPISTTILNCTIGSYCPSGSIVPISCKIGEYCPFTSTVTTLTGFPVNLSNSSIFSPLGLTIDQDGTIYVTDYVTKSVFKKTVSGTVTQIPCTGSVFPIGIVVDPSGYIYVSDIDTNNIYKITPSGTSVLAGSFKYPRALALDKNGFIYVAESNNTVIRRVSPSGVVSTFFDIGFSINGIALDDNGTIYVSKGNSIYKISNGTLSLIAGGMSSGNFDGPYSSALFDGANELTVDANGHIYVSDYNNNSIRMIHTSGIVYTVLKGGNLSDGSSFYYPRGIKIDKLGNIYVIDGNNRSIRKIVMTGSIGVTNCPTGSYCPTPTISITCPSGSYCPVGSTAPIQCVAGSYCPAGSTSSSVCPSGSYCTTPATAPKTCFTNYNCPEGSTEPLACKGGFTKTNSGGCQLKCPAGSYCPAATKSTPTTQIECPAGSFCPEGSATPTPCTVIGSYCQAGSSSSNICTAGSYCPTPATINTCTAGTYCPGTNRLEPLQCPAGTYCPTNGWSTTRPCPEGTYCPNPGTVNPLKCPSGSYCPTTGLSTAIPCPIGKYCPNQSNVTPLTCPAGSYCPTTGLSAATPCPAGSYCPTTGLSETTPCPFGKSCPTGSIQPIQPCAAGWYCPNGSSSFICPLGSYCPKDSPAHIICPAGSYCPTTGLTAATPCPEGKYCPTTGLSDLLETTLCPKGSYCPTGSVINTLCPAGTFCFYQGTTNPVKCSAGTYCPVAGSITTTSCPAGYYCPNPGTISPIECPAGYYCPYINTTKCSFTNYCPNQTNDKPLPCPVGYYCPDKGTKNPILCPSGKNCPQGTITPS